MSKDERKEDKEVTRPLKKQRTAIAVPKKAFFLWEGGQLIADGIPKFNNDLINMICCYVRGVPLPDNLREQLLFLTRHIREKLAGDCFWYDINAPFGRTANIQRWHPQIERARKLAAELKCSPEWLQQREKEERDHGWWIAFDGMHKNQYGNWTRVPKWIQERMAAGKPHPPIGIPGWIVIRRANECVFIESQRNFKYTVPYGQDYNRRLDRFYEWRNDETTERHKFYKIAPNRS